MTHSARKRLAVLTIPAAWLLGVVILWRARQRVRATDDPLLQVVWKGADDITVDVIRLTIECVVLYAIIRPGSYQQSWKRALLAVAAFLPWAMLNFFGSMHAGVVFVSHMFWLLGIAVGTVTLAIMSFAASRGLRFAPLFAFGFVGSALLAFSRWAAGTGAPSWMIPAMVASALVPAGVLVLAYVRRRQSHEAS